MQPSASKRNLRVPAPRGPIVMMPPQVLPPYPGDQPLRDDQWAEPVYVWKVQG